MAIKNKAQAFLDKFIKSRPQPSAPRAGYKANGSRYSDGGKITRKKSV